MNIIRVWACLGKYGWDIPWSNWHAVGVYAQPPNDEVYDYIYIYSEKGQDPNNPVDVRRTATFITGMTKIINADEFIHNDVMDYDALLEEIRRWHFPQR